MKEHETSLVFMASRLYGIDSWNFTTDLSPILLQLQLAPVQELHQRPCRVRGQLRPCFAPGSQHTAHHLNKVCFRQEILCLLFLMTLLRHLTFHQRTKTYNFPPNNEYLSKVWSSFFLIRLKERSNFIWSSYKFLILLLEFLSA